VEEMNRKERQEIDSIRMELHDMFEGLPPLSITGRLWRLTHRRTRFERLLWKLHIRYPYPCAEATDEP
jgi:hypothetical protein